MSEINERQNSLKQKFTNPILTEKKELSGKSFVLVFLKDFRLIRLSRSTTLKIRGPFPDFDHLEVFPFPSEELAVAFEQKVRYFYNHVV